MTVVIVIHVTRCPLRKTTTAEGPAFYFVMWVLGNSQIQVLNQLCVSFFIHKVKAFLRTRASLFIALLLTENSRS